jgi:hypothetical protein
MIAGFRLDHRQYFMLQNPSGVTLAERLLSANSDTVTIEVGDEPGRSSATNSVVAPARKLHHQQPRRKAPICLQTVRAPGSRAHRHGLRPLVVLFALLVVTRSFRSALVVITAFTIAHSITLAVATFNLVQLRPDTPNHSSPRPSCMSAWKT